MAFSRITNKILDEREEIVSVLIRPTMNVFAFDRAVNLCANGKLNI